MKATITCNINQTHLANVNLHICNGCFTNGELVNSGLLDKVKEVIENDLRIVDADDLQKIKRKNHILQGSTVYVACEGDRKIAAVVTINSKICQEMEDGYNLSDDYGTVEFPAQPI